MIFPPKFTTHFFHGHSQLFNGLILQLFYHTFKKKGKEKPEGTKHVTPKKRSRKAAAMNLPSPSSTPIPQERLSEQVKVSDIMDIFMDISSWLHITEHFIQEAENDKAVATTRRCESPSQCRPALCTLNLRSETPCQCPSGDEFPGVCSHNCCLV